MNKRRTKKIRIAWCGTVVLSKSQFRRFHKYMTNPAQPTETILAGDRLLKKLRTAHRSKPCDSEPNPGTGQINEQPRSNK